MATLGISPSPFDTQAACKSSHQSEWLQNILSDVDRSVKTILKLVSDCGKKSEVMKLLGELKNSYISLAADHDQLVIRYSTLLFSSYKKSTEQKCNNEKEISEDPRSGNMYSPPESAVEDPETECGSDNSDFELMEKSVEEFPQTEPSSPKLHQKRGDVENDKGLIVPSNMKEITTEFDGFGSELGFGIYADHLFKWEGRWDELNMQMMNLIEENLQKQAELVIRNEEKRETISKLQAEIDEQNEIVCRLQFELNELKAEKRLFPDNFSYSKAVVKANQSPISRLTEAVFGRLFRRSFSCN